MSRKVGLKVTDMLDKFKKNPILIMIAFAALASGVLWINVFGLLHRGALAYIGGIPAGIAIVGLVVYASNALPRVQSKRARQAGWFVLVLLGIAEPTVLGFANYPVIMNTHISQSGAVVVAGGASLVISLSLILGALVDRSLMPAEKPAGKDTATASKVASKKKQQAETLPQEPVKIETPLPQVARKPVKDDELLAYLASNPGASQQQVADHFHVTRQAIGPRIKKLYEVKA